MLKGVCLLQKWEKVISFRKGRLYKHTEAGSNKFFAVEAWNVVEAWNEIKLGNKWDVQCEQAEERELKKRARR